MLNICNKPYGSQFKDVILAIVVNIHWIIWTCRNKLRFEKSKLSLNSAIHMVVVASSSISGNISKGHMTSSMKEFAIFKTFKVVGWPPKALEIKGLWIPPNCGWIKCNIDGSARGSPGFAGEGGIFRDSNSAILG